MKPYDLSVDAGRDLAAVWLQGAERWGADQADRYLDQLDAAMRSVADGTAVVTRYPETEPPLVYARSGRHLLFAKPGSRPLFVAVLHERSDFGSRVQWRMA